MDLVRTEPVLVIATTVLSLLLTYVIYQRFFSPLAPIPGPFLASITNLWLGYAYWRQDWHKYAIRLHEKYGPIVRVGPDAVDVGDIGAIKVIYGAGSKFWKGRWYDRLGSNRGDDNLLSMTDEVQHKQKRRLIDPMYTLKSVRESEHLFNQPIEYFVKQMRKRKGQDFDIVEWMNVLAIDAFTAMTYGKANGLLEYGRAPEVLAFTELNWNPYFWAVMIPPLGRFAKLAQALVIGSKVLLSGGKPPLPILGWVVEQIKLEDAEGAQAGEPVTLLQKTLRLHTEHPEDFSRASVNSHMFEIVFAGFETCGATLPKMIYYIATTSGCQERLQQELSQIERASSEPDGLLTYDELQQLPYLSACIKETFRINPITGIALSRRVPKGGHKMNGYYLPEGTEIGITPWVTSYNKELIPEPERFKPERWLDATKEQHALMDRADLMFSAGPASCPGKILANALLYKVVAVVFSNFHITAITPESDIKVINIFPVKWRNVKMKFTPLQK